MEVEITSSLPNNPFETQDDALTDTQRLIETTQPTVEIEPESPTIDSYRQDVLIENEPETDDPTTLRPPSNSKTVPNRENLLLKTPQITDPVENPRPKRITKPPSWLRGFETETTE